MKKLIQNKKKLDNLIVRYYNERDIQLDLKTLQVLSFDIIGRFWHKYF